MSLGACTTGGVDGGGCNTTAASGNVVLFSGSVTRILRSARDGHKYFSGAATLVVGGKSVHSRRWPLVDRYVTMHGTAKPDRSRGNDASARRWYDAPSMEMVTVSYTVPSLTLSTLVSVIGDATGNSDKAECLQLVESMGLCHGGARLECEDVLKALERARLVDKVCETTRLLYMRDVVVCAQVYDNPYLMGKLNWRTVRKIAEIAKASRAPEELCFPDLLNLQENLKIPRLAPEALLRYMASENMPPPSDVFLAAVRLYQDEIIPALEEDGHCYLPASVVLRMSGLLARPEALPTLVSRPWRALVMEPCTCQRNPKTGAAHVPGCVGDVYFTARTHAVSAGIADRIAAFSCDGAQVEAMYAGVNKREFLEGLRARLKHSLDAVQAAALTAVFSEPIVLVMGSPGSGKSKCFIRGVKELHDAVDAIEASRARSRVGAPAECRASRLMLVAPTGMAVANVSSVCGGIGDTMDMVFTRKERAPETVDYSNVRTLVVEEASAVDEERLFRLLRVLPNLVQLVLVFDNNQLGPYGQGFPSRDVLEHIRTNPGLEERAVFEFCVNHRFAGGNDSDMASNARAVLERRDADLRYATPASGHGWWYRKLVLVDSKGDAVRTATEMWSSMRVAYPREGAPQLLAHRNETVTALNRAAFRIMYSPKANHSGSGQEAEAAALAEEKRSEAPEHPGVDMERFEMNSWNVVAMNMRVVFSKNYYNKEKKLRKLEAMAEATKASLSQENTEALLRAREQAKRRVVVAAAPATGPHATAATERMPAAMIYEKWQQRRKPPKPPQDIVSHEVRNGEAWTVASIRRVSRATRLPLDGCEILFSTQDARYSDTLKITDASGTKWVFTDDVPLCRIHNGAAVTVHKAQGSQYERVVYVVEDRESEFLTLNLLYTALTRAKEQVVVVCRLDNYTGTHQGRATYPLGQLSKIIQEHSNTHRFSGLGKLLGNPTTVVSV